METLTIHTIDVVFLFAMVGAQLPRADLTSVASMLIYLFGVASLRFPWRRRSKGEQCVATGGAGGMVHRDWGGRLLGLVIWKKIGKLIIFL